MADEKLTGDALSSAMAEIPEWTVMEERHAIQRKFVFKNFEEAFKFMTAVAGHAEEHDHHPEWFNVYNRVEVTLATHTASGITHKDIRLAKFMDAAAQ